MQNGRPPCGMHGFVRKKLLFATVRHIFIILPSAAEYGPTPRAERCTLSVSALLLVANLDPVS